MNSGIYIIYNLVNGHCYIGSSKNFEKRFRRHINTLNDYTHHNLYLQRAWKKYSSGFFVFCVLEFSQIDLLKLEQKWINRIQPEYNLGSVGGGDNISTHPNLEAIRKKHSINTIQRHQRMSKQEKQNLSEKFQGDKNPNWKGGKPCCSDCGIEISYQRKRCVTCCKQGSKNPFYGKKHSKKTIDKMRKQKLGKKPINSKKIQINGIIYNSFADAARALNVSSATITYRVKKHYAGYNVIQQ